MTVPVEMLTRFMQVLDLLRAGRTLTSSCRAVGMSPSITRKYAASQADLQLMFDDAMQEGEDTLAEILVEIDRDPYYGTTDPKLAKVISDNIKWLLARRRPKDYGDRMDVNVNVTADKEIIAALRAAQARVPAIIPQQQPMIDVTPTVIRAEDLV